MKSEASMTALLEELTHAVQVSTCPMGFPLKIVPARACLTALIRRTTASGPSPGFERFKMPVGEIR